METGILFDDLFAFESGLCHLRVYSDEQAGLVALAVQLDDNPGPSIEMRPRRSSSGSRQCSASSFACSPTFRPGLETVRFGPKSRESFDGHIPAGAHFFLSLTGDELETCRYHRHDWQTIAAAIVELLEALGPTSDFGEVADRAAALIDGEADRKELIFLFSDPIKWTPGATSIGNGQHRTCALKAAGAELCVALTHGELRAEPASADPYRRAQSALAEYWARRLGQHHPVPSPRRAPG